MDNLIYFPSDKIQSPYFEIKRFIDFVKQLSELNEDIRFDENYWKGEVNFVKSVCHHKTDDLKISWIIQF